MQKHPRWEDKPGRREQGCSHWCVLCTLKTVSTLNPLIFMGADFTTAATSPKQRLRLQEIGRHEVTVCIFRDGFSSRIEIRTDDMPPWCSWCWNRPKTQSERDFARGRQRESSCQETNDNKDNKYVFDYYYYCRVQSKHMLTMDTAVIVQCSSQPYKLKLCHCKHSDSAVPTISTQPQTHDEAAC